MTAFTGGIPAAGHTLATDQPLILDNFTYLNATDAVDHNILNNTASAQNGYHKVIHYVNQGGDPGPLTIGQLYTKTVGANQELFYRAGTSNIVTQLTSAVIPVIGTTGTTTLPGGLIMKWGSTAAVTTGTTIAFGTAFPTNIFVVLATILQNPFLSGHVVQVSAQTLNNWTAAVRDTGGGNRTDTINWIAIGN